MPFVVRYLEPVVVKVIAHQSVADFHEDVLNAYP